MAFEGKNPSEDKTTYREWTVSSDWSTIRSQSMGYSGKIHGDPGEYLDIYTRITDNSIVQTLIERFNNYTE